MPAIDEILDLLAMTRYLVSNMQVKKDLLTDAKYDLLFSVEEVNKLVVSGIPFREAYQIVGKKIEAGDFEGSSRALTHSHLGSLGNLGTADIQAQKDEVWAKFGFNRVNQAIQDLLA